MSTRNDQQEFTVADTKLTVLVDSDPGEVAVAKVLPEEARQLQHIRVLNRCEQAAASVDNLLVFSAASRLDHVAECVSVANKSHRLAALVVYMDVASNWLPYVLHQSGLRALRNTIVHTDPELPTRILGAWAMGAERDCIADAAVIKNRLVVRSCSFDEYSLSFDAYPALRAIPDSARSHFELEEEGLLLYWPEFDVHLDIEDIRFANDSKRQQEARAERIADQHVIGAAFKRLREEAGLKQSDIKGISGRHIRRIESGDRLTVDTIDAFAEALEIDSDGLIERLSEMADELRRPQVARIDERPRTGRGNTGATPRAEEAYPDRPAADTKHRLVRETLRLAAESSQASGPPLWQLDGGEKGKVEGRLEHDYRSDELFFAVVTATSEWVDSPGAVLIVTSVRLSDSIVSGAFTPSVGARILISSGRGMVPGDVSDVSLRGLGE